MKLDFKTILWVLAFMRGYSKALKAQGLEDLAIQVGEVQVKLMIALSDADLPAYKKVRDALEKKG